MWLIWLTCVRWTCPAVSSVRCVSRVISTQAANMGWRQTLRVHQERLLSVRYVDNFFIPPLPHLLTHSPSHFLPPLPSLSLKGNRTFNRNFSCRFCYQLPEDMKCCEPNTTCNVSQSQLVNLYISRISSSLASQTHFRKEREVSGKLCIQAVSCCTVQCGPITLQYFVTWCTTSLLE